MSSSMPSSPPSARFWQSGRNNLGALLALFAGLINIAVVVWPVVNSVGRGDVDPTWRYIGVAVGFIYIAAFFFADRRYKLSKALLLMGAATQILAALTMGRWYEQVSGLGGILITAFDFVPVAMALAAALLIGRAPTPAEVADR